MAGFRDYKGSWEIRWSYQGISYSKSFSIPKSMKAQAEMLAREHSEEIQLFISKLEIGLIEIPADCNDLCQWLFTAGKSGAKEIKFPTSLKLKELFEWFKTSLTWTDYEDKTKLTARIHCNHFIRLIGNVKVTAIGTNEIQSYINQRSKEVTRRGKKVSGETIDEELGTLSAICNAAHTENKIPETYQATIKRKALKLPKVDAKIPFQTIEQIEAQVCLMKDKVSQVDI